MKIVFIRHGQGEHTLNPPESLQIGDPSLTETGICQSQRLSKRFPLDAEDMIIVSPTRRTIQTALYWKNQSECNVIIHNSVGPRMFPLLPASRALPCDTPLTKEMIKSIYPYIPIYETNIVSWQVGINAIEDALFYEIADGFMNWCKELNKPTIYIVSHDGTITSYRKFLGETFLTRNDFLGETGSYPIIIR
jgi:hypothetical protein